MILNCSNGRIITKSFGPVRRAPARTSLLSTCRATIHDRVISCVRLFFIRDSLYKVERLNLIEIGVNVRRGRRAAAGGAHGPDAEISAALDEDLLDTGVLGHVGVGEEVVHGVVVQPQVPGRGGWIQAPSGAELIAICW